MIMKQFIVVRIAKTISTLNNVYPKVVTLNVCNLKERFVRGKNSSRYDNNDNFRDTSSRRSF